MKELIIKTYPSNFVVFYEDYKTYLSFDMFRNEDDQPCHESDARAILQDFYKCPPDIVDEVIRDMYIYEWIRKDVYATADDIQNYAEKHHLQIVDTACGIPALVGFEDFAGAVAAAKALGYDADWDIYDICKKNGFYRANGTARPDDYVMSGNEIVDKNPMSCQIDNCSHCIGLLCELINNL